MDTKELIKKVRKIEIKTRGLSSQVFSGEYHSAFKGRGMAFAEVREYMPGDEIRTIDWNVTARFNTPYVKVFQEERELTMMLLVDISGSSSFGTKSMLKRELIAELCAVLSFSAAQNNDKIGVILFSDQVELFIPPKKGKKHILRIIRELLEFKPQHKGTDIAHVLRHFNNAVKKKTIAFVISDFNNEKNLEEALKIVNKRHDLIALQITDPFEQELPNIGLVQMKNPETGDLNWVNTGSSRVRTEWKAAAIGRDKRLSSAFRKSGVDFVKLSTDRSYIIPLMNLFKKR
ncbi:MAG: DUF58 domain-containing protein [Flavobacteriales bacterium]|nr:DUF58 domain-containing protein [Flavobacteriales bacterium]